MVARLDMCCYALVCLANIRLKMKFTFKNIFVIFVLVTIVYESLYLYKTIVWDKSKIIGIIVFIVSLVLTSVILVTYLMSNRYRYKQYYISFPQEFERDINEFRINSMISPQYGTDTLRPGKDISKEIKKKISHCSICLVIISKKISTMQKIEISEMRAKHKKIIPILVDGGKLPSSLSKIVPICTTADQLSKVSLEEQLS